MLIRDRIIEEKIFTIFQKDSEKHLFFNYFIARHLRILCLLKIILMAMALLICNPQLLEGKDSHDHRKFEESLVTRQTLNISKYRMRLYNLNPHVNQWYLMEIKGKRTYRVHIDSRAPDSILQLTNQGLRLTNRSDPEQFLTCRLWEQSPMELINSPFRKYQNPFYPVCEGRIFIRLQRSSNTKLSMTEWSTEVLRRTDFGENIINSIKPLIIRNGAEAAKSSLVKDFQNPQNDSQTPYPALQKKNQDGLASAVKEHQLGISLRSNQEPLLMGRWYESDFHENIFVSLFTPALMDKETLARARGKTWVIQETEKDKLVYIIAYNLRHYQISYAVGTTQPPVVHTRKVYGKTAPLRKSLVPIGSIPPYHIPQTVGVFIGGFKERHSVFKHGPHKGKTYGYIESGVELAPMHDGLATIISDVSGDTKIIQWPDKVQEREKLRTTVVSARQNGVPLIKNGEPGSLVKSWKSGNWSADAKGVRTSLRAGVCIQNRSDERYLVFFAFTSATPSTMAKVMMAYRCENGMHLDMNAYMYLHNALFSIQKDGSMSAEYLNKEMLYPAGLKRHRFILDNNKRDFFYVTKRRKDSSKRIARNNHSEAVDELIPDYFRTYLIINSGLTSP